jgi:eukaryotic-like serine/threonine-protein kinase
VADDKKTQLGTGTPGSVPPSNVVVTPISPSGSFASPESVAPLATPPPTAMPLATQPGVTASALQVPTNVPTAAMAAAYPSGSEDPLVGKTMVGRYHIARKLGEGGMGSVYLASHIVLEKQVALKVLHGEYARKPDLVERFMQEAKAASRIRHENVIDISDFGVTEDGFVFFAMELLKGSDLHELVARARLDGEVLPWDRSRHIFLQICGALAAAHGHGIIHRDLKPENIYLIEFLGRPDFVKLLDFGIAKLAEEGGSERKLTRTGMLFGTPEYMSPEQARGDKVDHRVDIYAMACILYQLVTGRVPFEAENFMGVLSLHLTEPPPEVPPATLERCGAPPALAAIIAKGLAKKPDERWQTIEDMARAVRALHGELADEPLMSSPPVPAHRSRTHWTGKLEVPGADAPAQGRSKLPFAIGGAVLLAGAAVAAVMLTRGPAPATAPTTTPPTELAGSGSALVAPVEPGATPPPASGVAVAPPPVAPAPAPAPAPLPAQVTVAFRLAKGTTLLGPDGGKLGEGGRQGKIIELKLAGSDTPVTYTVRGKGGKERELVVIPDRDDTVVAALESESRTSGDRPVMSPGGAKLPPGTPGTPGETPSVNPPETIKPPDGDKPEVEPDDEVPQLKPFEKPADKANDKPADKPAEGAAQ